MTESKENHYMSLLAIALLRVEFLDCPIFIDMEDCPLIDDGDSRITCWKRAINDEPFAGINTKCYKVCG